MAFVLLYRALLSGLNVWTIPWIVGIFVGMQLTNLVIERIANEYVPFEER